MGQMPAASVIIRSFNEAEYIGDTLEAVTDQTFRDFEIILVDSGSTDGTLEIAEQYVDEVTFVDPRNFTFGYSLNVGCRAATGDYLVFLSAHAIPTDENWLGTMVENLEDENVAMTYSSQTGKGPTKFSEDRLFNELFPPPRSQQTQPPYFANNASSAIKRSLWERHQFDEYLTGHEDIEWAKHFLEKGYEIVYEPEACIYHIHDESWEQVYRRFEREAIADREIGVRETSERWREYAKIPRDMLGDMIAAFRERGLDIETFQNILKFRYNQHMGTARGLQKERDLDANRYEYYYPNANRQVLLQQSGQLTLRQTSIPDVRPNDVLIDVDYVGLLETDLNHDGIDAETDSVVPGRAYVGTVAELGANVESVSIDETVTGGSVFHCGICHPCDEGRYTACENRVELGTQAKDGALSQFITVPSNHVQPLPDGVPATHAPLAQPLSWILDGIHRVSALTDGKTGPICVVGNGLLADLTQEYLEQTDTDWRRVDVSNRTERLEACRVVVVASRDQTTVNETIHETSPGTIVLIITLEGVSVNAANISEKTLVTTERQGEAQMTTALEELSQGGYESLIGSVHPVEEFVTEPGTVLSPDSVQLVRFEEPW